MSFWRTLTRLVRRTVRDDGCTPCPNEGRDPDFSAAVTALGAKLARADGRADDAEYDAFLRAFTPDAHASTDIRRLYALARQTTLGFESYARRLSKRYRKCPQVLEAVVEGLFHIAQSDGAVTAEERAFMKRVAELFGLSPLTLRRIEAEILGLVADDPYAILEVAPDATDEAVRSAWIRGLALRHPDRAVGQSDAVIAAAHAKSAALNAAYDAVVRERRALLPAQAA